MGGDLGEVLTQGVIEDLPITAYSRDLRVHELVLRSCAFNAILRDLHRIARVVDVGEHLHRDHRPDITRELVKVRQVLNDVVDTRSNRLHTAWHLVLILRRVIHHGGSQIVQRICKSS